MSIITVIGNRLCWRPRALQSFLQSTKAIQRQSMLGKEQAMRGVPNKQLQRTVKRHRGDGASAPFQFALASRFTRQRAAAELRRYPNLGYRRYSRGMRAVARHPRVM